MSPTKADRQAAHDFCRVGTTSFEQGWIDDESDAEWIDPDVVALAQLIADTRAQRAPCAGCGV